MTAPGWVYEFVAEDVRAAGVRMGVELAADSLVRDPAVLAAALQDAVAGVSQDETLADLAADPLGTRPVIPLTTPARLQQARARAALARAVSALAAVELAERASTATWPHREAAAAARDRAFDALGETMEDAPLRDLRAHMMDAVAASMAALPEVARATPAAVMPSLVLAHDLYDDLARAAEIAESNAAPRPGFLPARPLEVLSR